METTERIVEAYVRYVKGWATIPNVRCEGQNEIDLIAIDPVSLARYHIEVSISISQGFRKLTAKPYDPQKAKERVHHAGQRRTVGFFREKKFASKGVTKKLEEFGFKDGDYGKIVVTWGWEDAAAKEAAVAGIELWDFRDIVREIADRIHGSSEYFGDDTLRTLNLYIHASDDTAKAARSSSKAATKKATQTGARAKVDSIGTGERFWVYENWTHDYAAVHRAACPYCKDGRGLHEGKSSNNGEWLGPFADIEQANARATRTRHREVRRCGTCGP